MSKPQIHVSGMNMFFRCPEQYRRRYIENDKVPPGWAVIIGTATHKSIEANMKHKIETGELLSIEELEDLARDAVVFTWQRDGVREVPEK